MIGKQTGRERKTNIEIGQRQIETDVQVENRKNEGRKIKKAKADR